MTVCVCVCRRLVNILFLLFKKTVWGEKLRTLLALYICIYILFIYEERPHNVDLYNVFLFFSYGTLAAASSKKHRKSSFYLQYIYIYFFMYKGEKSVFCSRALRPPSSAHILPWGKDRSQELVKSPSARNGQWRSFLSVVQSSARLLETGQDEPGGHLSVGR